MEMVRNKTARRSAILFVRHDLNRSLKEVRNSIVRVSAAARRRRLLCETIGNHFRSSRRRCDVLFSLASTN